MSSFFSFIYSLMLILVVYSANTNKAKKQLSPARIRAEGDSAFSKRDYSKALKYFNELIEIESNKHKNWHKRAMVYYVKNDFWKAITDWTNAIKIDKDFTTGYLFRGKSFKKLGECKKALSDFQKVYELNSSTNKLSEIMADTEHCIHSKQRILQMLAANGNCNEIQPVIEDLLNISPFDKKMNFLISECYFSNGDYQQVLQFTGNMLRSNPQNLKALLLRAKAYRNLNENEFALKHLKSGLRSDPDHKQLKMEFKIIKKIQRLQNAINAEMEKHQWKEALSSIDILLEIDPANNNLISDAYINKCKCATRLKRMKRSEVQSICKDGIKHNPESADAYYLNGIAYRNIFKWEEAIANFKNALSKNNNNNEYQQALRDAEFEKKKANRKDYYKILEVAVNASLKEIRKGFRKCGLKHHPDVTARLSAKEQDYHEAIFKECVEATEILSDSEIRAKYDRGEDVLEQQQRSGGRSGGSPFHGFPFGGSSGGQRFTFTFRN